MNMKDKFTINLTNQSDWYIVKCPPVQPGTAFFPHCLFIDNLGTIVPDALTVWRAKIFTHIRALHFAWCSLIVNWPRIMFSKRSFYDFSTVTINAVKSNVLSHLSVLNHKVSVSSHLVDVFHVFHVLQTFSVLSNPGLQDSTVSRALTHINITYIIQKWSFISEQRDLKMASPSF